MIENMYIEWRAYPSCKRAIAFAVRELYWRQPGHFNNTLEALLS